MTPDQIVHFDPEGAKTYPSVAAVESYLGGVGLLVFPNGTVQFAESDSFPDVVYSPRMKECDLELFCKYHMEKYKRYFDENFEVINQGEKLPPFERFWE